MKKVITITAILAVAGMAQASWINWGGNFVTGTGVYEYTDSKWHSEGMFTTGFTAYLMNSSIVHPSISDGWHPGLAEMAAVTGSAIASTPIFIKGSGFGQKVSLTGVTISVPDNTDVYTILTSDNGFGVLVLDNPTNVGQFDPPVAYTPTQTISAEDSTISMGSQNWLIVPEPSSVAMMGLVSGLGVFVRRRFQIV